MGSREADMTPRCDVCGRFMSPGSPGTSWVSVPAIDMPGWQYGDERDRCARCTASHGRAEPVRTSSGMRLEMVCGYVEADECYEMHMIDEALAVKAWNAAPRKEPQ